jgi:hypothetical protein
MSGHVIPVNVFSAKNDDPWIEYPRTKSSMLRFHILTATSRKMAVFWDVASCNLVDTDQYFRAAYLMIEAVGFSEISVNIHKTRRSFSEDSLKADINLPVCPVSEPK